MAQQSFGGNKIISDKIKRRRRELGLTIEEAANKAGVGIKTWCRYEAGEAIRSDKYKGVCKAMHWLQIPTEDNDVKMPEFNIEEYKNHEAWSAYLEKEFGEMAAVAFSFGSDLIMDHIKEDLGELARLPRGTHIGQIGYSYIGDMLPKQFLMEYDYDFLYAMLSQIISLRKTAKAGKPHLHNVLDEIILKLIDEESELLIEENPDLNSDGDWGEWRYKLCLDSDVDWIFDDFSYLSIDHMYHYFNWFEELNYD